MDGKKNAVARISGLHASASWSILVRLQEDVFFQGIRKHRVCKLACGVYGLRCVWELGGDQHIHIVNYSSLCAGFFLFISFFLGGGGALVSVNISMYILDKLMRMCQ